MRKRRKRRHKEPDLHQGINSWRPLCHFLWKSKFHGVFSRGWEKTKKRFCFFSLICLLSLLLSSLFFVFLLPPIEPFLCLRCLAVRETQSANVFSLLACTHTHTHNPPALEDAQTHTPALTYICWVWWMPMCKFFKRFSGHELEWVLLLAEFLCLGPPRSAPRFAQ